MIVVKRQMISYYADGADRLRYFDMWGSFYINIMWMIGIDVERSVLDDKFM